MVIEILLRCFLFLKLSLIDMELNLKKTKLVKLVSLPFTCSLSHVMYRRLDLKLLVITSILKR